MLTIFNSVLPRSYPTGFGLRARASWPESREFGFVGKLWADDNEFPCLHYLRLSDLQFVQHQPKPTVERDRRPAFYRRYSRRYTGNGLGEAAVMAFVGSLAGIAAGWLLAKAAIGIVTNVSQTFYGLASSPKSLEFNYSFAAQAFVVGIVASMLAAWLPARAASQARTG
jgi:hypothetical protein